MHLSLLLSLSASAAALRVAPARPPTVSTTALAHRRPSLQAAAAAAAAAFVTSGSAFADEAFPEGDTGNSMMDALNSPAIVPSSGGGFELTNVGYVGIGLYVCYLAWSILRPPSEAELEVRQKQEAAAVAAENAAPAFLAAAAAEEGAVRTASGLIHQPLSVGSGASPTADDTVVVHYQGTLADGTIFDSSRERGEPTEFKVGQVIKGWQEGLQLMKLGGKSVLTIPAELAYGPMTMGSIPGRSALKFEVELLEIKEGKKGLFGGLPGLGG